MKALFWNMFLQRQLRKTENMYNALFLTTLAWVTSANTLYWPMQVKCDFWAMWVEERIDIPGWPEK